VRSRIVRFVREIWNVPNFANVYDMMKFNGANVAGRNVHDSLELLAIAREN